MKKRAQIPIVLAATVLTACQNNKIDDTSFSVSIGSSTTDISTMATTTPKNKELSDVPFSEGSTISIVKSRESRAEDITQDEIE